MSRRTDRVEDLLRAELCSVLLRRLRDPRVRMATVSAVEVSPDLKKAVVLVSAIGTEEERTDCLQALQHASGFIRSCLAKELRRMRNIPELMFELDRGAEYSQQISDLLETLHDHEQEST